MRESRILFTNFKCLNIHHNFENETGNKNIPGTPHYIGYNESNNDNKLSKMNDYQKAIYTIGNTLTKLNIDKKIPVWGFGVELNDVGKSFQFWHMVCEI